MQTKDYFSGHSKLYATFRPEYPQALYEFIFKHLENKFTAWDCATGNGQVARYLSRYFKEVYATDISQQQLNNAYTAENIFYSAAPSEKTPFQNDQFDLITVGQALHWFTFDEFYNEVKRVGKNNSLLAAWGYGLCSINEQIDTTVQAFYHTTVGPYWDVDRKHIEDHYKTIPFPFETIPSPEFQIQVEWSLDQFAGYLTSWSSIQKYIQVNASNPVIPLTKKLQGLWPDNKKIIVRFPIFLKLGIIRK